MKMKMKKKTKSSWRACGGEAARCTPDSVIPRLLLLCLCLALAACKSSQTENLFNTGRDARVYNPISGRYEWPDQRRGP